VKLFEKEEGPVIKALRESPIFSGASTEDLRDVVSKSVERSYEAGRTIVKQGELGIGFYLILEGQVNVVRNGKKIATLGKGNFFGEMGLLHKQPRSADVITTEPTKCLVLSEFNFWGIISTHPRVARGLVFELARRLRETDKALGE
jgi:CRP-like cAMP-binding protein